MQLPNDWAVTDEDRVASCGIIRQPSCNQNGRLYRHELEIGRTIIAAELKVLMQCVMQVAVYLIITPRMVAMRVYVSLAELFAV